MHKVIDRRRIALLWDSLTEPSAVGKSLKREYNRKASSRYSEGRQQNGTSEVWFGAPDVAELMRRLDKGWDAGAERLSEISVGEINPTSIRRRRFRSDQGDELDMQSVWRGDLSRAWSRTRREGRFGTRVINVMVNVGDNASAKAEALYWRGGSALRLADALTQAGYAVGIYAAEGGRDFCDHADSHEMAQFVEIKSPDSQLDLSLMAGLTAMPGWFRTQGFAGIVCAADMMGYDAAMGLGKSLHDLAPFAEMIGLQGEMVFQPKINSKIKAEEWIAGALRQIEPQQAGTR